MMPHKTMSFELHDLRDVDSCLGEIKKLHEQLEEERQAADKKERMMAIAVRLKSKSLDH